MRAEEAGSAGDQDTMSRQNKVSPVLELIVPQAESATKPALGTLCFLASLRLGPALGRRGFDRCVLGGPAYTEVGKTEFLHHPGVEKVAAVDHNRIAKRIA